MAEIISFSAIWENSELFFFISKFSLFKPPLLDLFLVDYSEISYKFSWKLLSEYFLLKLSDV